MRVLFKLMFKDSKQAILNLEGESGLLGEQLVGLVTLNVTRVK